MGTPGTLFAWGISPLTPRSNIFFHALLSHIHWSNVSVKSSLSPLGRRVLSIPLLHCSGYLLLCNKSPPILSGVKHHQTFYFSCSPRATNSRRAQLGAGCSGFWISRVVVVRGWLDPERCRGWLHLSLFTCGSLRALHVASPCGLNYLTAWWPPGNGLLLRWLKLHR